MKSRTDVLYIATVMTIFGFVIAWGMLWIEATFDSTISATGESAVALSTSVTSGASTDRGATLSSAWLTPVLIIVMTPTPGPTADTTITPTTATVTPDPSINWCETPEAGTVCQIAPLPTMAPTAHPDCATAKPGEWCQWIVTATPGRQIVE